MSGAVEFELNRASEAQVAEHLTHSDADFLPPLSTRIGIDDYARKIADKAMRFEAWSGAQLVGLVAAYCNDRKQYIAYITSVSVLREWTGKGIAVGLMQQCIAYAKTAGMRKISLEVTGDNTPARRLYEKCGFVVSGTNAPFVTMELYLK